MSRKSDLISAGLCLLLALSSPAWAEDKGDDARKAEIERWLKTGEAYIDGKGRFIVRDHEKAVHAYEQAARLGSAEAHYRLGNLYFEEKHVQGGEYVAMDHYRQAAEMGHGDAQMILGVHYIMEGIKQRPASPAQQQTYTEAVKWLQKAAAQDVAEAQYWYGDMLVKGLGTEQDAEKGRALIRQAAEAGNPNGQAMLAALYWQGQAGLEKNLVDAYKWMYLAAVNGNENAPVLIRRITAEMDEPQREAAKKAADGALAKQKAGEEKAKKP